MEADAAELDRQSEARLAEIEQEVKKQPLTSEKKPLSSLESQYSQSQYNSSSDGNNHRNYFVEGIRSLVDDKRYGEVRIVRGDGNCYYRAFLYGLATACLADNRVGRRVLDRVKTSYGQILSLGYDETMLEMFYDSVVELLTKCSTGTMQGGYDVSTMHTDLNEEGGVSDYCTWFLRVITAMYIKTNPDRFLPFIMNTHAGMDIDTFCKVEVEPVGKECEQIQAIALAEALQIQVVIEYLDGHELSSSSMDGTKKVITSHTFGPEDAQNDAIAKIVLLYRPGHYDILYPK